MIVKFTNLLLFCVSLNLLGQTVKMHRNVTNSIEHEIAPKISADGSSIIFLRKNNRGGSYLLCLARKKKGKWLQAVQLDKINKQINLIQEGGYCLNEDGSVIIFSSKKYGGVGGYDLWTSVRGEGYVWSSPVNLAMPVNSKLDDLSPSLSADGTKLYFSQKDSNGRFKIVVSEKRGKSWGKPKAMASTINSNNARSPFIHPDSKTLYFSSDMPGGKGKYDVYVSRLANSKWSKAVNVVEVNSGSDDLFISMSAKENVLYFSKKEDETYDLYKTILSEKSQATPVYKMRMRLHNLSGDRLDGYLRIKIPGEKKYLFTKKIKSIDFQTNLYLSYKGILDFTVYGIGTWYYFYSEMLDLSTIDKYTSVKKNVVLEPISKGQSYSVHIEAIDSTRLTTFSIEELKRLKSIVTKHPGINFDLEFNYMVTKDTVVFDSVVVDSVIALKASDLVKVEKEIRLVKGQMLKLGFPEGRVNLVPVEGVFEELYRLRMY